MPSVVVLIFDGVQFPMIPLVEVVGRIGSGEFWHSGPIGLNTGVTRFVITTFMDAVVPHCPAAGVNVYVVVPIFAVLIVSGLQVPVKPSLDVVTNAGGLEF